MRYAHIHQATATRLLAYLYLPILLCLYLAAYLSYHSTIFGLAFICGTLSGTGSPDWQHLHRLKVLGWQNAVLQKLCSHHIH
jgi:hypothetical protein